MKKPDKDPKKEKKFLNMPTYPGGTKALKEFINNNLKYPPAAIKKNIEGTVVVSYDIDHQGLISNIHLIKSLGFGCDEEAVRLVSLLQFNQSYNKGIRVKKTMKLRVDFQLRKEQSGFHYEIIEKKKPVNPSENEIKQTITYSYSIPIN
jgi:TonB family protein